VRAAAALALLGGWLALAPAAAAASGAVRDVRHWSYGEYTRVVVELSQPVATAVREAPADPASGAPARLYVDLPGIHVGRTRDEPIPVRDGLLRRIRVGQFTRATTRVVLDLERWERHRLLRLADPDRIVIDVFGPRAGGRRGRRRCGRPWSCGPCGAWWSTPATAAATRGRSAGGGCARRT
jgi:hypothetical protein